MMGFSGKSNGRILAITYSKNLSLATLELSFIDMLVIFAYSIYSTEKIRYLAIGE